MTAPAGAAVADGIAVQNPATGELVATVAATPPTEVAALVARARAAQPAWEALGFEGRAEILHRASEPLGGQHRRRRGLRHQAEQLLAAVAVEHVGLATRREQDSGDAAQRLVTGRVPEPVVVGLELVDVEHHG